MYCPVPLGFSLIDEGSTGIVTVSVTEGAIFVLLVLLRICIEWLVSVEDKDEG